MINRQICNSKDKINPDQYKPLINEILLIFEKYGYNDEWRSRNCRFFDIQGPLWSIALFLTRTYPIIGFDLLSVLTIIHDSIQTIIRLKCDSTPIQVYDYKVNNIYLRKEIINSLSQEVIRLIKSIDNKHTQFLDTFESNNNTPFFSIYFRRIFKEKYGVPIIDEHIIPYEEFTHWVKEEYKNYTYLMASDMDFRNADWDIGMIAQWSEMDIRDFSSKLLKRTESILSLESGSIKRSELSSITETLKTQWEDILGIYSKTLISNIYGDLSNYREDCIEKGLKLTDNEEMYFQKMWSLLGKLEFPENLQLPKRVIIHHFYMILTGNLVAPDGKIPVNIACVIDELLTLFGYESLEHIRNRETESKKDKYDRIKPYFRIDKGNKLYTQII